MPKQKYKLSPRFAIKLNKYVYRTKLLPEICICGTTFIQMKIQLKR